MMDENEFLEKEFSSLAQEAKPDERPEDIAIPEEEVSADFPEKSETKSGIKKSRAELEADAGNAKIIEVLKTIDDPEINIDIWTLELIYNITHTQGGGVEVLMTFTSPMCPFGPQLMQMVKDRLEETGIKPVDVNVTFSPAWKPSEEVREMLGV